MSKVICVACRHEIDAAARLCPYCGADPQTGAKIDTQKILQQEFHPRHVSATEGMLEYVRQRQGVVIAVGVLVTILLLAGLRDFVMRRNQSAVSDAAAVPLTDVADLSNQAEETRPLPMPDLQFQYDGHPQTMRTFIVEPGAVPPPDVIAAQQQSGGQPPSAVARPPAQ